MRFSLVLKVCRDSDDGAALKLSVKRNETETKQLQNSLKLKTVLFRPIQNAPGRHNRPISKYIHKNMYIDEP